MNLKVSQTLFQQVYLINFNMKKTALILALIIISSCTKGIIGEDEPNTKSNNFQILWDDFDQHYSLFTVRNICLLYTSPSPRDKRQSRMPSSA